MGISQWFQLFRKKAAAHSPVEPIRSLPVPHAPSIPTAPRASSMNGAWKVDSSRYGGIIPPQDLMPERWHAFYRYLRDHIPDVSAGVWAWVRLCSTAHSLDYIGGTTSERADAQVLLEELERRLLESTFDHRPGFDGLIDQFYQSVFTVGAYSGEVVALESRSGISHFAPIDPSSIRFKRYSTSGRMTPCQLAEDGSLKPLPEVSFFYYGLDADAENPYGRSPLSSLPFVLRLQQQLFEDMGKAAHNAGYPSLHVRYQAPEREPGEGVDAYRERIQGEFDSIDQALRTRSPESNFLTQANVEIAYVGPNGQMLRWRETLETISEQVVSALHLAPFLIGRNYGTTQSWARAQYDLMINNAASVQRAAARLIEWIANLELAFHRFDVRVRCRFAPHHGWNDVDEARARQIHVQTLLTLKAQGLIEDDRITRELDI